MSRRDLLEACRRLSIRTDHVAGGKRGSKDNNWLRTDLLNRTYGPGMHWQFYSAADADQTCTRAVECCLGGYGSLLSTAQGCLRSGVEELAEYKRLCGLKKRRPKDEARLLHSSRQWMQLCRIAQEMYKVDRGIQFGMYLGEADRDH